MNFSDETVNRLVGAVQKARYLASADIISGNAAATTKEIDSRIVATILSSLTLADLMQVDEVRRMVDDVSEYLHWRDVNKHIKGGENYLKRMRETLKPFLDAKRTQGEWTYEPQDYSPERVWSGTKLICHVVGDSAETQETAAFIAAAPDAIALANKLHGLLVQAEAALKCVSKQTDLRGSAIKAVCDETLTALHAAGIGRDT